MLGRPVSERSLTGQFAPLVDECTRTLERHFSVWQLTFVAGQRLAKPSETGKGPWRRPRCDWLRRSASERTTFARLSSAPRSQPATTAPATRWLIG
ncbi:hypothetical protein OKW34_008791 [Paraburkholderia youngii]